jgi:hypothetical protein
MATKAIAGIGTLVKIGDGGSPEVFTSLSEVRDIDGPKLTADEYDVTSHSSPGAFSEFIPGMLDAGTIDFGLNFVISDVVQAILEAYYLARRRFNIQIVLPLDLDNTSTPHRTSQYIVFVKNASRQMPVKGALARTISLRVVGAPTLQFAAS